MLHFIYLLKTYPLSLLFCLRYLPLRQAVHVPIIIGRVKIGKLRRGDISLCGKLRHGSIVLGMPGSEGRGNKPFYMSVHDGGKVIIGSNVTMASGTTAVVKGATLTIGSHFFCNENCTIFCTRNITIGEDCLWGWNVELNTTDGHKIYYDGIAKPHCGEIIIGKHVWLCSESHIGKNVSIADGCVVAQRSLVIKHHLTNNTLIGGIPAKDIKYGISWEA